MEKKAPALPSGHQPLRNALHPDEVDVVIQRVDAADGDARWSSGGTKPAQRWGWHASDHPTGTGLAYGCGRRHAQVFLQRTALLDPCGITRYDTDYWGASTRHRDPDAPQPGKRNTQHIERTPLDVTDPGHAVNPQDHRLFPIDPDAGHCPWGICQSLRVWAGDVQRESTNLQHDLFLYRWRGSYRTRGEICQ